MMLWLVTLEVEIEDDKRPKPAVAPSQGVLDDRPNPLEEVLLHARLGAGRLGIVRQDGAATEPQQILLDRDRHAQSERAVDTVVPPTLLWIAIVRIEQYAPARREILSFDDSGGKQTQ